MAKSKKNPLIFGDGPLEKANLVFMDPRGGETMKLPVQFNPKDYTIARDMDYKKTNGIGQEVHPFNAEPVKGVLAKLTVTVFVDVSTELKEFVMPSQFGAKVSESEGVAEVCKRLSKLTKYNHEYHLPESIMFSWGSLQFLGNAISVEIAYEMFNIKGKPVKAKINLTIEGEEMGILKEIKANPNESPDRTKYRNLGQVDELWMLAYDEYNDLTAWKVIAKENGILNPRKLSHTTMLKVPSI